MEYSLFFYALLGFLGSFFGTIPFGPINLSVVDTTLKDGMRSAMIFALAAAIIEFLYSYLSLTCYWVLNEQIEGNPYVPGIVAIVFIFGGIFFFLKRSKGKGEQEEPKRSASFVKGLVISTLNPQAVPYWIFVISFYKMQHYIDMSTTENIQLILSFVIGAAVGKVACLWAFAALSKRIAHRLTTISLYMNKIIGVVLIVIGLSQVIKVI
ncbi:MAG: LysE family transporter [Bacteroidota bacterium]